MPLPEKKESSEMEPEKETIRTSKLKLVCNTVTEEETGTVNENTEHASEKVIAVENNRNKNRALIIVLSTVCLTVIMFVLGMVINMVKYNNPIDGGVLGTTIAPLIEIFKVIIGV